MEPVSRGVTDMPAATGKHTKDGKKVPFNKCDRMRRPSARNKQAKTPLATDAAKKIKIPVSLFSSFC